MVRMMDMCAFKKNAFEMSKTISSFLSSLDLQTQAQKFVKIPPAIFFLYF